MSESAAHQLDPSPDVQKDIAFNSTSRLSRWALVATLTVVAAVVRLFDLGRQSLWFDEALSVAIAHRPWGEVLWTVSRHDAFSPYLVVLRLWILNFGDSEAAARMPSVIFSVATLGPLYALARRLAGNRVAAFTAILFAVNGFSLRYAQETRCYSMMILLVVGSWIFFLRCLDSPTISNCAGYVATTVLGAYTHIFSALSYPAQWIPIMRRWYRSRPRMALIASVAISCALILPKGLSVILTDVGQDNWVFPLSWTNVLGLFAEFSGSLVPAHGELLLLTVVYLAVAGFGALALIFGDRKSERGEDVRWFILLGCAIPIGAVLLVSVVKPLLVHRYLSEALPFFIILCAVGLCRMRPRWMGAVGLAAIAVMSLHQDHLYYPRYQRDDWRSATTYILNNAKPGDAVVLISPASRWPYDYYASRSRAARPPSVVFPDWDPQFRVAGLDWTRYYVEPEIFAPMALRVIDEATYPRIWLVMWLPGAVPGDPNELSPFGKVLKAMQQRLLAAMDKRYRLNSMKDFSGLPQIRVWLYDRAGDAAR